jgi:integrase/recombinase XerD
VARFVRIARKQRLDYDGFLYVCQQAQRKLGLRKPKKEHRLPQLLSEADLKRFFHVIQDCGDVQHEIMLKRLFYTAVRVSELVRIQVTDIDLDGCRIFIDQGKGSKDRYILFPTSFRLVLKGHLRASPQNRYLFETRHSGPFTPRRVQQIVQEYRQRAGLDQRVHPHMFRHQMLSHLTPRGYRILRSSLFQDTRANAAWEVYQHLSLEQVERAYQAAVVLGRRRRRAAAADQRPQPGPRPSMAGK